MWINDNGKYISKCDRCHATIPDLSPCVVRVANIHVMEICTSCIQPLVDDIRPLRSVEAQKWYFDTHGKDA